MTREVLRLQSLFKLLGDTSRLKIVLHLMRGEECVCTIGEHLGLEQTLVSHHLHTLREGGLIQDRKAGTWIYCSLNAAALKDMGVLFHAILGPKNFSKQRRIPQDACRSSATPPPTTHQ